MATRVAAVPAGSAVNPCCCEDCHGTFGDEMDVTISGIVLCGCFQNVTAGPVTRYWQGSNLVGVNGNFPTVPFVGSNTWSQVIGTIDLQEYEFDAGGECLVPIGDPFTTDVTLAVSCVDGTNALTAEISATVDPAGGSAGQIFSEGGFFAGDVVPNSILCVVVGNYFTRVAAEGQLTVAA